jgi:3-oxoacyl-[acyl-carrier-protein] synthase-3
VDTSRVLVAGCGRAVPDGRLTNQDLERRLDTDDRWITERTGIKERRVAAPTESTSTLAAAAGAAAIKDAGLTTDDIGFLIVATTTPDQPMPATSAFVADALSLRCGSFDLNAACAGFAYATIVGSSLVQASGSGRALVIGADVMTSIVNPMDRNTAVLFGDGAGAVVLSAVDRPAGTGILGWDFGTDGSGAGLLQVPAGGSARPTSSETLAAGAHWMTMDGREVFRRAVRVLAESSVAALAKAGLTPDDVDLFVPHQANIRIIDATATRLGFAKGDRGDRTFINVDRYGNTSAGSIPIALAEAAEGGRLRDGDVVLLSGIGAGLTWASVVLRWGRP